MIPFIRGSQIHREEGIVVARGWGRVMDQSNKSTHPCLFPDLKGEVCTTTYL